MRRHVHKPQKCSLSACGGHGLRVPVLAGCNDDAAISDGTCLHWRALRMLMPSEPEAGESAAA
jgi:hypothetical protein